MADGDAILDLDGNYKLDASGNMILSSADDTCRCACSSPPPHHECGSDSSCNNYCDESKKAFSQGAGCGCPCDSRRDYPRCYDSTYTGFSLKTGVPLNYAGVVAHPTDAKIQFDYDGHVNKTIKGSCITEFTGNGYAGAIPPDPGNSPANYHLQNSDGSDYDGAHVAGTTLIEFSVSTMVCSDPAPYNDPTKLKVIVKVGSPTEGELLIDHIELVDRCNGGSFTPVLNPDAYSGFFVQDVGSVTIAPYCPDDGTILTEWDGSPCTTACISDTATAQQCAGIIGATVTVWDSDLAAYVDAFAPTAGDCNGYTLVVEPRADEDPGEECCPNRDPNDCADCADGLCEECWSATLTTPSGTIEFWGQGPCPPPNAGDWRIHSVTGFDDLADPEADAVTTSLDLILTDCDGTIPIDCDGAPI